ncbi:hypothetical protein [Microcoleus sp. S11D4]|uniref:hypothetical protein n=1 Tax=Microcoleus sp. S11D4 TaxID=3055407 RepID=UPI002FD1FF41
MSRTVALKDRWAYLRETSAIFATLLNLVGNWHRQLVTAIASSFFLMTLYGKLGGDSTDD